MNSYGKVLSIVVIIALMMSVFFVFGAHELKNHFCPINAAMGICGFLGNLTQIIDHIFSLNVFLAFVLPATSVFAILLASHLLIALAVPKPLAAFSYLKNLPKPKVKISESRWLNFHINSPTL